MSPHRPTPSLPLSLALLHLFFYQRYLVTRGAIAMSSEDFRTKQLEANAAPQGAYESLGTELSRATTIGGHVADNSQYGFPIQHRKLAAPLPLGLFAFATTTFA